MDEVSGKHRADREAALEAVAEGLPAGPGPQGSGPHTPGTRQAAYGHQEEAGSPACGPVDGGDGEDQQGTREQRAGDGDRVGLVGVAAGVGQGAVEAA